MITTAELESAFQKLERKSPSASKVRQIIKQVDYRGNGKINYSEFVAATISVKKVLTNEKLYVLFKHFDVDDSGFITSENLEQAFAKNGR